MYTNISILPSFSFMCPLCFALLTSTTPPPKLHLTILGRALAVFFPHSCTKCKGCVPYIQKCALHENFGRYSQPFCVGTALFGLGWVSLAFYTITGDTLNPTSRPIQNQPPVHGYSLVSVTGQEACEYTGILFHHVQFDTGDLILHSVYHSVEKRKKQGFCHSLVAPWQFACQPASKTLTITIKYKHNWKYIFSCKSKTCPVKGLKKPQ